MGRHPLQWKRCFGNAILFRKGDDPMKLSPLISDGMVLQRHAKIRLGGLTAPGGPVRVTIGDVSAETVAGEDGAWSVTLDELQAGGPYEMVIAADEERVIRDVLVGDVWVLGGQSNMELPVRRTLDRLADDVHGVRLPHIRQFAVPQVYNFHGPQRDVSGGRWTAATGDDVLDFSAVGFFFARSLHERYGVPVGLIQAAVGGTPVEAWMREETLRQIGGYEEELDRLKDDAWVAAVQAQDARRNEEWYRSLNERDDGMNHGWHREELDDADWETRDIPGSWRGGDLDGLYGAVWFRRELELPDEFAGMEAKLMLGTIVDADDTWINGVHVGSTAYRYPPRRYTVPAGVLKAGRNTIAVRVLTTHSTGEFVPDMPYKLVVGGAEIGLAGAWRCRIGARTERLDMQTFFQYKPAGLYNGMIAPLKDVPVTGALWYQGESNAGRPAGYRELFREMVRDWRETWGIGAFPFLYVQLANFDPGDDDPASWAPIREEQRLCLSVPNTAMTVAIDVGEWNDLHPQDKKTVGERLALGARRLAYGEDVVFSGPLNSGVERLDGALRVRFDHTGSGLVARGGELGGFEVCGADGRYVSARAVIDGDGVVVSSPEVPEPVHVRYAWRNHPADANLYNREGLPASPFSSAYR